MTPSVGGGGGVDLDQKLYFDLAGNSYTYSVYCAVLVASLALLPPMQEVIQDMLGEDEIQDVLRLAGVRSSNS